MLTSHIATLSYYAEHYPSELSDPALYRPIVDAILASLKGSEPLSTVAREDLRILNDQLNTLLDRRKAELEQGLVDSDTRKKLSGFKPVVDQFNFITKVVGNIASLVSSLPAQSS